MLATGSVLCDAFVLDTAIRRHPKLRERRTGSHLRFCDPDTQMLYLKSWADETKGEPHRVYAPPKRSLVEAKALHRGHGEVG